VQAAETLPAASHPIYTAWCRVNVQHRHVGARRLERAKELLSDADRALADIAVALSFSCQANFTRAVRQATGQTPAQNRRSLIS